MADVKIKLIGNGWDSLNPILNNSTVLNNMLDEEMDKLEKKLISNIDSSGSEAATRMKVNIHKNTREPNKNTGIKMRFLSIPGTAFEMKYSVLGRALDGA
jgi:hypothetical protein